MKISTILTVSLYLLINTAWTDGLLPDYIKPCSLSDPKLNECILNSARGSMKRFAQGDPERGIPPLEPLTVKELKVLSGRKGDGLNVKLTDCKLYGCANLDMTKFKIDLKNKKVFAKVNGDLKIDSTYNLKGRILIIPLVGQGHALVKLNNVRITFAFDYDIVERNGSNYIHMLNDTLKYDIGRAYFNLENLFNGDKIIGESTNRLLNDSWKEIIGEVGPPVAKILKDSFRAAIEKFLESVTENELFLP